MEEARARGTKPKDDDGPAVLVPPDIPRDAAARPAPGPEFAEIRLQGTPALLHRDLWQDALTVGLARDPWQMEWLPEREEALLEIVDAEGVVVVDEALGARLDAYVAKLGRELEARFLALRGPAGTKPRAATARTIVSWRHWAATLDPSPEPHPPERLAASYRRLEAAADAAGLRVPWRRRGVRDRRWR